MACDIDTLLTTGVKFGGLGPRELKIVTLYFLCNGPNSGLTENQAIAAAVALGYDKLGDKELNQCIVAAICAGGGGVGSSNIVTVPAGLDPLLGTFTYGDITGLTKLTINATTSLAGYDIESTTTLTELDFPNLVSIDPTNTQGGYFSCTNNSALTTLSVPLLVSVSGIVTASGNPALTTLSFPLLTSMGGSFNCENNSALTTLSLPLLVSVASLFRVRGNSALTTVDMPRWVPTNGPSIEFSGCALNTASVEQVLRRCVLAGVTTCTIDLSGGTNAGLASLSVQGQADAATLGIVPAPGAQLTINA